MYQTKDLTNRKTIAELVEHHRWIVHRITAGYKILESAQERIDEVFPDSYARVLKNGYSAPFDSDIERAVLSLKKGTWRYIVNKSGVRKILSVKRAKDLETQLEKPKDLPEISIDNVLEYLDILFGQSGKFAEEAVHEVFKILTPDYQWHQYKTNDAFKVGKKVILTWCLDSWGSKPKVRYEDNQIRCIDRVFHLLDGQGIPGGYNSELGDCINGLKWGEEGETKYFKVRAFKNLNVHLTFKRMDLVKMLNQVAGGELVLDKGNGGMKR